MSEWRSCDNCKDYTCYHLMQMKGFSDAPCDAWKPMRCRCGGALSITRYHNGKPYRHCYSCHFEFFQDGEA